VDREGLEELFAPFAVVSARRMFGGHGVYADGLCFSIAINGDVYLKVDAETRADFAAVDSRPFVYAARGREVQLGYWLLPSAAFDERGAPRRNGWRNDRKPAVGRSRRRSDRPGPA
jgi:DNA transformation protein